ncbi:hypothetical protein [Beijerinckia sp. L45]|uniref:hypothetical protein n=1 Tax=Beijerinckia sp. L45 TaxID=1641855 RepID=UPI00131D4E80|nr:hypothetical protein [Beijerinckia sp. L45]
MEHLANLTDDDGFIGDAALPEHWTSDHVARRLVDAFKTLDRMPRVRGPRQPGDHWPRHRVEWADQLAQAELPESEKRERAAWRNHAGLKPSSVEITAMDTSLEWLRELRSVDTGMALVTSFWALRAARRRSVRALCREKGWAPHTFYRLRAKALEHLANDLNARHIAVF